MAGMTKFTLGFAAFVYYFATANGDAIGVSASDRNNSVETQTQHDHHEGMLGTSEKEKTSYTERPTEPTTVNVFNEFGTTDEDTSIEALNECGTNDTGYKFRASKNACYKLHPERASWDDAEATCVREGGHLAVAWNKDDGDILYNLYLDGWSQVYLGLRQKNGSWVTSHGEAVELVDPRDEPENKLGIEYCSSMDYHKDFDLIDCSRKIGSICEKDPNSQPLPAASEAPYEKDPDVSEELLTDNSVECGTTGYKLRVNTSSCYKFYTELKTWDDAQATCIREGGYLAVGSSSDNKHFYLKYLPPGFRRAWLNRRKISTIPKETREIWSDYTLALSFTGNFILELPRRGKGNFICEKDSNSRSMAITSETKFDTTETATKSDREESSEIATETISVETHDGDECNTTETGYIFLASTKKCYKLHTQDASWYGATRRCINEGAHLAVINSQDEVDFFKRQFSAEDYPIYVGFHLVMGSWVTIYGQTLAETGYEKWNEGEPNNNNGDQNCGAMYYNGTFDDVNCYDELLFICVRNHY